MADEPFSISLWYNTQLIATVVDSLYLMVSERFGITPIEWHVLHILYRQDGQRPTDLAHAGGRKVTSFTAILDSLERKGWVVRQADILDRRVVHIHLTEHAQQNRTQFEQSVITLETYLHTHLSEPDLHDLVRLREQLVNPES